MAAPANKAAAIIVNSPTSMHEGPMLGRGLEQSLRQRARLLSERGDPGARLVTYADIVNASPIGAVAFRCLRHQAHAKAGGGKKSDAALLRNRPEAVGVAGKCQGAVRQGKDE